MNENLKILAIETSCDETAAALIVEENSTPRVITNIISSQIDLHAKTGGVVPEVASRAHIEAILPVIAEALVGKEKIDYKTSRNILKNDVTHIAVTAGPGLIGSLLIGFNAAKTISYALKLPIIAINHIEGHLYSAFGGEFSLSRRAEPRPLGGATFHFPLLALTVSGGHTSLILMKDHGKYKTIGQTLDDAVGEAYDKVASLLKLGYPGGPIISKMAQKYRESGEKTDIIFPRPILKDGTYNFSLSGLKTSVLQKVKDILANNNLDDPDQIDQNTKENIAAAFEEAVGDVLAVKTAKAVEKFQPKMVIFVGGVSANKYLGSRVQEEINKINKDLKLITPAPGLSGDNAAMIGLAAYYHIKRDTTKSWQEIKVDSNLAL